MGVVTESYLKFKYHFETLRKAHLLLNFAPAVESLKGLINAGFPNAKKKAQALDILEIIEPIERNKQSGKVLLKEELTNIKNNTRNAYDNACYFVSMKRIVERIEEELGFNPFFGRLYSETYINYIREVDLRINEHNKIMKQTQEQLRVENIDEYLIKKPTFKTNIYEEWHEILFKEKPRYV